MEYKIISNKFRNNKLIEKTIFYYETEEKLKIAFNYFIESLIKNKFIIDIYNKKNHITAINYNIKLEITTHIEFHE